MLSKKIEQIIRDVPDFPKPGILFKDITPIMMNAEISREIVDHLVSKYKDENIQAVAGIESRGFLFGYPLAMALNVPFILVRKKGKLPYHKVSHAYQLEYGEAEIEMHTDALSEGQRVLIHDDLLATGGSAEAAAHLIEKCGGLVAGFNFIVELDFLAGRKKLNTITEATYSLVNY